MGHKISVIIPVYNRFQYLGDALQSVFSQNPVPDEVILVDDCSTTSLQTYLRVCPPPREVRVLRTDRNRRVAGARNWGWRRAEGDLIAFLDSDDTWEPGKLERQVRYLDANPSVSGVYGSMTAHWPDGRTEVWADNRSPVVNAPSALIDHNITVQTLLIRRSALETLNGFDENFGILDDQDIAIRMGTAGLNVHFFGFPPVARHRRHSSNHSDHLFIYFKEECRILRRYRDLYNRTYGPGSDRVRLGRAVRRWGVHSRWWARIPATMVASLLYATAPSSAMPRELWGSALPNLEPVSEGE